MLKFAYFYIGATSAQHLLNICCEDVIDINHKNTISHAIMCRGGLVCLFLNRLTVYITKCVNFFQDKTYFYYVLQHI